MNANGITLKTGTAILVSIDKDDNGNTILKAHNSVREHIERRNYDTDALDQALDMALSLLSLTREDSVDITVGAVYDAECRTIGYSVIVAY